MVLLSGIVTLGMISGFLKYNPRRALVKLFEFYEIHVQKLPE